jgi:hypothetical protein
MSESTPSSTSKRFCDVFQMTAKERGKMAQTGSALGTFKYRQQHPKHPELVFNFYRKRADGTHSEAWMLAEEMELRHQQRVTSNLARARARGVPERTPAAPREERKRKLKETQRRIQEKKREAKQKASKMTHEQDVQRWQILAQMLGKPVEEIMPK